MRTSTLLTALSLGLLSLTGAQAAEPIRPTVMAGGQVADTTTWYTMTIGDAGLVLSDNGTAASMSLSRMNTDMADADLWCFVGNQTDGYRIINKQAGPGKVLASPVQMSGTTGGTAYVVLRDTTALDGYVALWQMSASTYRDNAGWYIYQKGIQANAINNRNGRLAFWTTGKDAGSTVVIEFAKTRRHVDLTTGSFAASSSSFRQIWNSSFTNPALSLNAGYNNMKADGTNITAYTGRYAPQSYTFTTDNDCVITGFAFDFKSLVSGQNPTITVGNTSLPSTNQNQHIAFDGGKEQTAAFVMSGGNYGVLLTNIYVDIQRSVEEPEWFAEVFPTKTNADIPYRIPALAQMANGDLLAMADYRYCRADIGYGAIDLHARISHDNGLTWDNITTMAVGGSVNKGFINTGFGDVALVADSESPRVLVLCCSGNVSFQSATRDHHQAIARFYSEDYGKTWSQPDDISPEIYAMFDNSLAGAAKSMFVGSGRICQSKTVKVGQYYRLYCAILLKDVNGTNKNYVLYSDNFGQTWDVLGGVHSAPVPSGADEPKTEELPDGSVLISSRVGGGRYFNIFHYTDPAKAQGSWGTVAFSGASNNGVAVQSASCNGEALMLPAKRVADGKHVWLALQSLPTASSRARVGVSYKELASLADFYTADGYARDWDGGKIVSKLGSAYSTLQWLPDSTLGVLLEEDTYGTSGGGYNIIFKKYSIEALTDSVYTYCGEVVADSLVANGFSAVVSGLDAQMGTYVGMISTLSADAIHQAAAAYEAAPSRTAYEAFHQTLADAPRVALASDRKYRVRNCERQQATLYLVASTSGLTAATRNESAQGQLFSFYPTATPGQWTIACDGVGVFLGSTGALETKTPVVTAAANAAAYRIVSATNGKSHFDCVSAAKPGYPALHLAGDNTRIVPWTTDSPASQWYIEPTDLVTDLESLTLPEGADQGEEHFYDLSGRRVQPTKPGLYVTDRRRKVQVR